MVKKKSELPQHKPLRRAYGFDEVAIVPGDITVNPDQTNIELTIENHTFPLPIVASAMDAVTDVNFAVKLSKMGGLAVLHLEGVQTRYENPGEVLARIAQAPQSEITGLMQEIYAAPIKENLIGERIQEINQALLDMGEEPGQELERKQLETTLAQNQQLFASLLQTYESVRLAKAESTSDVVLVEPAFPPDVPIRPKVLQNTLLAAVVGGMLAVGLIFLIDALDNTIKGPDDVTRHLLLSAPDRSPGPIPGTVRAPPGSPMPPFHTPKCGSFSWRTPLRPRRHMTFQRMFCIHCKLKKNTYPRVPLARLSLP